MIVAHRKSIPELMDILKGHNKVLVLGCGTCVTVCFAGGSREAAIVASSLRMASKLDGNPKIITDETVQRQCEWEYLDQIAEQIHDADVVLSLGRDRRPGDRRAFPRSLGRARPEHQLPGYSCRAGRLGRTLRSLRRLYPGSDRRHLSYRALL